jgi:hypothetical protein
MKLQDLSDESLQRINQQLTRLVELKNANEETNLDDLDLVEKQAREYAKRREAGYSKAENPADSEIRDSVREWLKRSNRYRNL